MARREESIDQELLAQLESGGDRIRVPIPNRKVNEMFAIADQILGGRRVRSICEDGETRLSRIPGKMRRRQWVREGDLIGRTMTKCVVGLFCPFLFTSHFIFLLNRF